jgi:hypothetical protein
MSILSGFSDISIVSIAWIKSKLYKTVELLTIHSLRHYSLSVTHTQ